MGSYILQVVLFQLLFLVVYEVLFKKETFFSYNRAYLLISPGLAFLIPFLKIELLGSVIPVEAFGVMLPEVVLGNTISQPVGDGGADISSKLISINWWAGLYFSGALLSFIVFLKKYNSLRRLFKFQKVTVERNYEIVEIPNSTMACTFFNTIFLGESLSENQKQAIIPHEIIHVKQKHSLDLLFFELLRIVFWFNPLVYIYQSHISGVHEFLADKEVVKLTDKKQYYHQLLNTAFNTQNISFINQFFNHSLIKKRIVMLQKSQSKSVAKFKYLIVVPLMLVMLTYVSCGVKTTTKSEPSPPQTNIPAVVDPNKNNDELENVPFALIDQVPIFPGCENMANNDAMRDCVSQKIQEHVQMNFNTNLGKELGFYGINRIIVQFRIDETGEITQVKARAPHQELETEAMRVINALPKMSAGRENGKAVGVMYSLPIVFQVEKTEKVDEKN